MNNDIVQLTDKSGNNIYPIAGGATQDSISKSMLAEGVFEGPELFPSPNEAYVRTDNIVDGAVTSSKIDSTTLFTSQNGQGLGSFTLSDAIENYDKLEIEYADVNGNRGLKSFRVVPGGVNQITLTTFQPGFGDAAFYIQSALVAFAGTNGNVADSKGGAILNGSYPSVSASDNVKVLSVVGYK